VQTPSSSTANARFTMRFDAAHPGVVTRDFNPGTTYDAFYALAYAAFANGDGPVTGPSLARAFTRLVPPGREIEVGPSGVLDAVNALSKGENIDLEGAAGRLDFDPATGEAPTDLVLVRLTAPRVGVPAKQVETGLVYHASKRAIEGTMRDR
jgi:hypothetical protein